MKTPAGTVRRFGRAARGRALAVAGVLGTLPSVAAPASGDPAPGDLGTVTVIARVPRPLSEAAASISVFDAAGLGALEVRDLGDLARYEPGLAVPRDATRFGTGDIEIRGIGGNRVLLEVDGVPAASRFAIGNFSDAGRAILDLDLIRRVEVLRGPASSLYGSDALGGVVALRTWDPEDVLADAAFGLRARAAWRGDDDGRLATALAAVRVGSARALLGYAQRDASELDNGDAAMPPNPADRRTRAWLAKLALGERAPLRLTLQRQDVDAVTDVRSLLLQPGRFANTVAMRGDDASGGTLAALDQQLVDAGPFAQAEWRVYWRRSAVEQSTFEERRAVPPRTPPLGLVREFRYLDRTTGAEATASREFRAAGLAHRLVAGFEVERTRVEEARDGVQTDRLTLQRTRTILGETFPLRDFPITTTTRIGVYAQDHVAVGARGAWIPSLRVDRYRLVPRPDAIYTEDNPRTTPVAISRTAASPRLGATWRTTGGATLYAQYAHGFRAPPSEDVNVGLDLPLFNTRAIPNPDLKPEKSDGLELGIRADTGRLRGTASAFLNRYADFIESKVNLGPDASGTTIFQSRNVARARIWGVEATGTWAAGAPGSAWEGWFLRGALAYARGDDTGADRPLNAVAPAKGVLGGGYADPAGRWGAGALATVVAAKTRVADGATRLFRPPGYATLDVDAWWRPAPALELRVALLNATGRSYFQWADVRGRAANDPSLELYRRPGRSLTAAVTWSLR